MTKIVYNTCFGGFSLSEKAIALYKELGGTSEDCYFNIHYNSHTRTDPVLVKVVETLGKEANGHSANLAIRDLPTGTKYRISEYDGSEDVVTIDEYKWSVA